MLTPREFDQLKTAIECMQAVNLVNAGGDHISRHNVLVLLSRFAEEGSSCFVEEQETK